MSDCLLLQDYRLKLKQRKRRRLVGFYSASLFHSCFALVSHAAVIDDDVNILY